MTQLKTGVPYTDHLRGALQEGDEMAVNADKIISIARAEIGTKATNIKKCKYNNWYYGTTVSGSGYDWCETFVQWVFHQAGASSLLYTKTANCGYAAKAFQDHGRLVKSGFKRGDVVFFHWTNEHSTLVPGTYVSDHVGIIESVNGQPLTFEQFLRYRWVLNQDYEFTLLLPQGVRTTLRALWPLQYNQNI